MGSVTVGAYQVVASSWHLRRAEMGIEFDSTLRTVAWLLAAWLLVSVVAAVIIPRLFRARARLNDQLAADGRRADWAAASGDPAADASGTELSRR